MTRCAQARLLNHHNSDFDFPYLPMPDTVVAAAGSAKKLMIDRVRGPMLPGALSRSLFGPEKLKPVASGLNLHRMLHLIRIATLQGLIWFLLSAIGEDDGSISTSL